MKKKINLLIMTLFSVFFVSVFYKQSIGLNLFLFNVVTLTLLLVVYKVFDLRKATHLVTFFGTVLTAFGVLFHASVFVIILNILSLILLMGIVNNKELKLMFNVFAASVGQALTAFIVFLFVKKEDEEKVEKKKNKSNVWKWVTLSIIPLVIVIIFYQLYRASSSKFESTFGFIGAAISNAFEYFFTNLNFSIIFLFILGFIIACAYFTINKPIVAVDETDTDELIRTRSKHKYNGEKRALLTEFYIGVILFVSLNVLLALFNVIDIWHVWFNFKWNGELLKEFVHEGTYILIFTLILLIALVLIFFRKNLNFFSKNKSLKILANIWIVQNGIMTISVLIRNLHYINYYNLAYLRIGVIMFVVLAIIGLVTVFIKINYTKNFFYLTRVNMLFVYVLLVLFSLPDWDVIIAKFNFNRSEKAFVHLNFMADLADKTLPYIDKSRDELDKIEHSPVYKQIGKGKYIMNGTEYISKIEDKKTSFLASYPGRTFLEWNYANYIAYKKLMANKSNKPKE